MHLCPKVFKLGPIFLLEIGPIPLLGLDLIDPRSSFHISQAPAHSLLTQWSLSVTIHLRALSNLDAGPHIETTAGQLIRQPEDSGQRKTVKISSWQIFSSSIESREAKYLEILRGFSLVNV